MASKTAKQPKQVTIICRAQFKSDSRKVCYKVLSSDGVTEYWTCLFDGRATSCECPATGRCYHMTGCEHAEQVRQAEPAHEKLDGHDDLVAVTGVALLAREAELAEAHQAVTAELKKAVFAELQKQYDYRVQPKPVPVATAPAPIAQRGSLNGSRAFSLMR